MEEEESDWLLLERSVCNAIHGVSAAFLIGWWFELTAISSDLSPDVNSFIHGRQLVFVELSRRC